MASWLSRQSRKFQITASDEDESLAEVPWDGTLEGETIELKDDEEEWNPDTPLKEARAFFDVFGGIKKAASMISQIFFSGVELTDTHMSVGYDKFTSIQQIQMTTIKLLYTKGKTFSSLWGEGIEAYLVKYISCIN